MRTSPAELHRDAVETLRDVLSSLDLAVSDPLPDHGHGIDILLHGPREVLAVEVKALSLADQGRVQSLIDRDETDATHEPTVQRVVVLVADELPEASRDLLKRHGWGYLDRRGSLSLKTGDLFVNDTTIAPTVRNRSGQASAIRGRVGLGAAVWILMHPGDEVVTRQLARELGASPSTVHEALNRLRDHALIDGADRPLVPELFDAVAAVWRPDRIAVARQPELSEPDDLGLNPQGDASGWVVSGAVGAAASGASIVISDATPPDFYVPSAGLIRRAVRRLGKADFVDRGATVALAPTSLITDQRGQAGSQGARWRGWPVAHPVAIALDLAQDQSRGREILAEWAPAGADRVW